MLFSITCWHRKEPISYQNLDCEQIRCMHTLKLADVKVNQNKSTIARDHKWIPCILHNLN